MINILVEVDFFWVVKLIRLKFWISVKVNIERFVKEDKIIRLENINIYF